MTTMSDKAGNSKLTLLQSEQERLRLWCLGYDDTYIAESVGLTRSSICLWRIRYELPANFRRERDKPLGERFDSRWVEDINTGCWVWQGHKSQGYGLMKDGGVTRSAHRVGWELKNGPIPEGLQINHKNIDNRTHRRDCVNPDHLYAGTHSDNMSDMAMVKLAADPAHFNKKRARFNERDVMNIRILHSQGVMQKDIAAMYRCSNEAVHHIVNNIRWTYVHVPEKYLGVKA